MIPDAIRASSSGWGANTTSVFAAATEAQVKYSKNDKASVHFLNSNDFIFKLRILTVPCEFEKICGSQNLVEGLFAPPTKTLSRQIAETIWD